MRRDIIGFEFNWRTLAAVCALVVCVGCARRHTENLAFEAPKGWVYSAVPRGGQVWVKGGGSNESIMAQATESPLPQCQPGWKDITICGNIPPCSWSRRATPARYGRP